MRTPVLLSLCFLAAVGLRVTDVYGHRVEDLDVVPGDGSVVASAAQLPECD